MRPWPRALAPLGLAALVGCDGGREVVPDATLVGDASDVVDVTDIPDITPFDAGRDTGPDRPDVGEPLPTACLPPSLVELSPSTEPDAGLTRYVGTTTGTPRAPVLPATCVNEDGRGEAVHQVMHRYVPRRTGRLRLSLDDLGTDATFDTVLFAQRECRPLPAGAASLGCNDDANPMSFSRPRASEVITARVPAGDPVFIVVAGYPVGADAGARRGDGAYALTVYEIPDATAGEPCDPIGRESTCVSGTSCASHPDGALPRCIADGVPGGRCRATEPGCDTGLRCVDDRCRDTLSVGDPCGPGAPLACPEGSTCQWSLGGLSCLATGARDGDCRDAAPRCNAALACVTTRDGDHCRPSVGMGLPCDPAGLSNACAADLGCGLTSPDADGVCTAPGAAAGAPCRAGIPRCDGALTCVTGPDGFTERCVTTAAAGASCDPSGGVTRCASGTSCAPVTILATGACAAAGTAAGAACRASGTRCDGVLQCSRATGGVCQRVVATGEPCDARWGSSRCDGGGCVPTGTLSAACRPDTVEVEPDDTPETGVPFVGPAVSMTGALEDSDVIDCARLNVEAGDNLAASVSTGDDRVCEASGGDPALSIYDPTGAELVREDDSPGRGPCATVAPWTHAEVRSARAGLWSVCVRRGAAPVPRYRLTVGLYR